MTTTFIPAQITTSTAPTSTSTDNKAGRVTWLRGLTTGAVAAAVVTAVVAAFEAAGHGLAVGDGPIPLAGFSQMVMAATVIGIVIARHTSRTAFYRATVVLTALSCLPDLALGQGVVSRVGLITTHLVAAAIIVPRLARSEGPAQD
jgi:hypothetical protein